MSVISWKLIGTRKSEITVGSELKLENIAVSRDVFYTEN